MSQDPAPQEPLQFDKADFQAAPVGPACKLCQQPIATTYFDVNGQMVCPGCRESVEKSVDQGIPIARALKAAAFGMGGGLLGALVWYLVAKFANLEIGLIAILVGYLVGRGVSIGSGARGGWFYQSMAVGLTYLSVSLAYAPFLYEGFLNRGEGESIAPAAAAVLSILFSPAVPVTSAFESPIGGLILLIALWEAWRRNPKLVLQISGPFEVSQPMAAQRVAAEAAVGGQG